MDVLLINPPNMNLKLNNSRMIENMGLCYLAAVLKKEGYSVEVLDCRIRGLNKIDALMSIMSKDYKIIGISVPFQEGVYDCIEFVRALRQMGAKSHITMGGHPPSFLYEQILEMEPMIDSIIIGEGEYTLLELAQNIDKPTWRDINGIAYVGEGGKIIKNKSRAPENNLDNLPLAYRYMFEDEHKGVTPSILSSRGCYANCSFCDIQSFHQLVCAEKWRARTPKSVVDEIEEVVKARKINKFFFADDEFIGPGEKGKQRAYEIAREMKKRQLGLQFTFSTRVNGIDEDLLRELKEAGLTSVFLGVESGSEKMLKYLNKGTTKELNINAIRTLEKLGIEVASGSILIGPFTTIEDIEESIELWEEMSGFNMRNFNCLTPYAGTKICRDLEEMGALKKDKFSYSYDSIMDSKVKMFRDIIENYMNGFLTRTLLDFKKISMKLSAYIEDSNADKETAYEIRNKLYELRKFMFFDSFKNISLNIIEYLKGDIGSELSTDKIDTLVLPEKKRILDYLAKAENILKEIKNESITDKTTRTTK